MNSDFQFGSCSEHVQNKMPTHEYENKEGLLYLQEIENDSINLILTDPPYIISRESGMNTHYNNVKNNEDANIEYIKSVDDWNEYKERNDIVDDSNKDNYLKYGTIYGKKYCVKTDFGEWDSSFTMETLEKFIDAFYKKLKKGGTLILFFDLWKIESLKRLLEKYRFKQIRMIEWIKKNPQPLNSKINYLTNCREVALTCVKGSKPTFNAEYQTGIYEFSIPTGKTRFHPTQKSLKLFEKLIEVHSNENDVVLDTFLGSGTTLFACKNMNRSFKGCELNSEYTDKIASRL
jgi:site-specific DNA-methyltransferase (adenine-specific)